MMMVSLQQSYCTLPYDHSMAVTNLKLSISLCKKKKKKKKKKQPENIDKGGQ
jgi:hypothetical protein